MTEKSKSEQGGNKIQNQDTNTQHYDNILSDYEYNAMNKSISHGQQDELHESLKNKNKQWQDKVTNWDG